jgi:hypothetical protein
MEVTLSLGLFAILTSISLPAYRTFQTHTETGTSAAIVTQSLRRASALSRAGQDDTTWGVNVQPGTVTLFQGASYAARDVTYDEDFDVPSNLVVTGTSEFVFAALTGNPTSTGTVTLTAVDGRVETITLNEHGMASY